MGVDHDPPVSEEEQARREVEYERILAEWRALGVPEMQARRIAAIESGVVTGDLLELPPDTQIVAELGRWRIIP